MTINNMTIPIKDSVRYLGMTLERRMTWKQHIINKSKQFKAKLKKFYWLIGRRSNLSTQSKITLYKTIINPVWTYGIQLWRTASISNIKILQRFQSKTLRSVIDTLWYVTNEAIHCDLKIPIVKEEIIKCNNRYIKRVIKHRNPQLLNYLIRRIRSVG